MLKQVSGWFCGFLIIWFGMSSWACASLPPDEEAKFDSVREQLSACAACHGEKGKSLIPQNPILAGQHLYYIFLQLRDFKNGARENVLVNAVSQQLPREDMLLVAEYFSEQEWPQKNNFPLPTPDDQDILVGKQVVSQGQCVQCHLGKFEGASGVPRVGGQYSAYIEKTRLDFKYKRRNNSPAKSSLLVTFSDEEIKAVPSYITNLLP